VAGHQRAIATPEKNINSVYIILMGKLRLSKELLNENELRDFSQHYSIIDDDYDFTRVRLTIKK
jgi:hypothetical protein